MHRPGLKSIWAFLLTALLLLGAGLPVDARPGFFNRNAGSGTKPLPSSAPSGKLQEVAPPGAVQQLRQELQRHRPSLRLVDPTNDSVVSNASLELSFDIDDWPLSSDPELGLGPHVAIQIDNRPPLRVSDSDGQRVRVQIDDLDAGSHRFSAWAAYPWGEAVQAPGASIQGRIHLWRKLHGTQPEPDAPWLVPVTQAGGEGFQPLLVDWLIWNAPLQNLREGDGRWRMRISVDGDSFLVDHQEALWLKGSTGSSSHDIQMELLNGLGEPITPVFNNQLIHLNAPSGRKPGWMQSRLNENQLARLSGSPAPEEQEAIEPLDEEEIEQEAEQPAQLPPAEDKMNEQQLEEEKQEEDKVDSKSDVISPDLTSKDEAGAAEKLSTPVQEQPIPKDNKTSKAVDMLDNEGKTSDNDQQTAADPPEPLQQQVEEEEKLMPSSSLGGSARELLNSDGRLRNP